MKVSGYISAFFDSIGPSRLSNTRRGMSSLDAEAEERRLCPLTRRIRILRPLPATVGLSRIWLGSRFLFPPPCGEGRRARASRGGVFSSAFSITRAPPPDRRFATANLPTRSAGEGEQCAHSNAIALRRRGEVKRPALVRAKSITPRGCDRVQAEIAEHVRHQARGLEYFRKGRVANA
jgi:hypothetical protein